MKIVATLFSIAFVLSCAHHAHATVYAPADFQQLVRTARAIAHGRIVDVHAQLSDDRRRIETLVTMEVAAYLKGDLGPTVTFRVPGGQFGRYRMVIIGAPRFRVGEEVILLLSARGPSIPYVLGLSQGVFRVVADANGEVRVTPAPLVGETADWKAVKRGDPSRRPRRLSDFTRQVQQITGAQQ